MKRYCKNIDIKDRKLISEATYNCLDGKMRRRDTIQLFALHSGLTCSQVYCIQYRYGEKALYWIIEDIIDVIRKELIDRELIFPKIWYKKKIDGSSGKERRIGIQDIKQQIYDYVAAYGLRPIFKRIGTYQYASIKGRGPEKGARQIKRWLKNKKVRYIAKMDVRKCFESISKANMMSYLKRYVKNEDLLWLVEQLLDTFEQGLSIGSYLSQWLCNLYISQIYHEVKERMYRIRKKRHELAERENLATHLLIYMDDIYLDGTSSRNLHQAIRQVKEFAASIGLHIKDSWIVMQCKWADRKSEKTFIDIMGRRIYRWHMTIRHRVFRRIRRCYKAAIKCIKTHKKLPEYLARRCLSYLGAIKNTNSYKVKQKYKVAQVTRSCKRRVRSIDKSKVCRRTTGN